MTETEAAAVEEEKDEYEHDSSDEEVRFYFLKQFNKNVWCSTQEYSVGFSDALRFQMFSWVV